MIRLKYVGDGGIGLQHPEPGRKPPPLADFTVLTSTEFAKLGKARAGKLFRIVDDPEGYAKPLLEERKTGEGDDEKVVPPLYERIAARKSKE